MQSNDEEFLWSEKYRPRTIRDCILPKELSDTFLAFIEKGEIPNMLLNGSAGVGKTSVARALCEELGWDYILINSGESSGIDKVRTDMRQFASSMSLQGKPKAIILDEADRITIAAQSALHGFVEEFSQNCRLILTSNHKNKIFPPLHSRTTVIDFHLRNEDQPKMAAKFMKRVKEILKDPRFGKFWTPLPFNAGYFLCLKLHPPLDANRIRRRLYLEYDTGVIAIGDLLRVAFSSVPEERIPELFENIAKACEEDGEGN